MRIKILVLATIAFGMAVLTFWGCNKGVVEPTKLVPAWQITTSNSYDCNALVDPVASWSPDSKSLLFMAIGAKYYKNYIYQWNVGGEKITRLVAGYSPNYISNNKFLYYKAAPKSIVEYDIASGRERQVGQNLAKSDLWAELKGFSYDPERKCLNLRFANFTRYYEPGCEAFDLTGKYIGRLCRTTGAGVLDRSDDTNADRAAFILGDLVGTNRQLRISKPEKEAKAKTLAQGSLGAVAWSPDGKIVAFADSNEVKVLRPDDGSIITVARFGKAVESANGPYVSRLIWSPNSSYIAAVELVPGEFNTFMMIYVLDMSKFVW